MHDGWQCPTKPRNGLTFIIHFIIPYAKEHYLPSQRNPFPINPSAQLVHSTVALSAVFTTLQRPYSLQFPLSGTSSELHCTSNVLTVIIIVCPKN
jgi:hypothetical protein